MSWLVVFVKQVRIKERQTLTEATLTAVGHLVLTIKSSMKVIKMN